MSTACCARHVIAACRFQFSAECQLMESLMSPCMRESPESLCWTLARREKTTARFADCFPLSLLGATAVRQCKGRSCAPLSGGSDAAAYSPGR